MPTRRAGGSALPKLLTVREVSEATGLPKSTVYDAVYARELEPLRFGRSVRLAEADVAAWIARHRETAP